MRHDKYIIKKDENNPMINLLYGGNSRVFHGLLLNIMSLTKHSDRPLRIFVFTMDLSDIAERFTAITEQQCAFLDERVKTVNPASEVIRFDLGGLFREQMAGCKNLYSQYTPYTILRLFVDIIPEIPDKILYLDIDTMFCRDAAELYDIDISQREAAVSIDFMGRLWIDPLHFNAGVMLMNVSRLRETGAILKAREMCKVKKMGLVDQEALNRTLTEKLYLPRDFNEQRRINNKTVVKHFNKGIRWFPYFKIYNIKQWNIEQIHNFLKITIFDDIYAEYDKIRLKNPDLF